MSVPLDNKRIETDSKNEGADGVKDAEGESMKVKTDDEATASVGQENGRSSYAVLAQAPVFPNTLKPSTRIVDDQLNTRSLYFWWA